MNGGVAVVLIAAAAATAGCVATLADIRQAAPDRVGRAAGDYRVLAGCITEGLQTSPAGSAGDAARLVYQTVDRPDEKRMLVTGVRVLSHAVPAPLIDLTFRQLGTNTVVIESRWGGLSMARGDAERVDRGVWSVTERCAGGRVELTPPIVP